MIEWVAGMTKDIGLENAAGTAKAPIGAATACSAGAASIPGRPWNAPIEEKHGKTGQ